jgi:hypothetical protein
VLGNISLKYIAVSFSQAVGSGTPFFTAVLALALQGAGPGGVARGRAAANGQGRSAAVVVGCCAVPRHPQAGGAVGGAPYLGDAAEHARARTAARTHAQPPARPRARRHPRVARHVCGAVPHRPGRHRGQRRRAPVPRARLPRVRAGHGGARAQERGAGARQPASGRRLVASGRQLGAAPGPSGRQLVAATTVRKARRGSRARPSLVTRRPVPGFPRALSLSASPPSE